MRRLLVLVSVALVATACGGAKQSRGPYLPGPTADCLRSHGFHASTRSKDVQLLFATAGRGGLHAWHDSEKQGNQLQIAFATNRKGATIEYYAIRRQLPRHVRLRIFDVARVKRNAVILWTIAPTPTDDQAAIDCLRTG
jgi:hypothetical protein